MKKRMTNLNCTGLAIVCLLLCAIPANCQWDFSTSYFKIRIDNRGYVTSMKNITVKPEREFSPSDKPSPLMCLYNCKSGKYLYPVKAVCSVSRKQFELSYDNGSVATIRFEPKRKYFRITLLSLTNRDGITDIQWGSYHTSITNLFGEIIGVARDTSDAVNYAIGVLALNDFTTGGTSDTQGDAAPFQYVIHTPDKVRIPLPDTLHESQLFSIGGDGISDVAFYAHHEEYFRILYGNSAFVDDQGRIFITYHAMDRTKPRDILFSLIPFMPVDYPVHQEVQALPGVDYIGSSIALWGSPDSTALMDVIQDIVLSEKLPYPKVNGKWVKDPARYIPDALVTGNLYDSIVSYVAQLGFKAFETGVYPFFKPDRANEGYIDGKNFEKKPFHFTSGNKSHKEFTDISNPLGILIGRHTITTALAPGTKDASPIPSDSLCYLQKRILAKTISATDTVIEVNDPKYLEEVSGWEGHANNLNIIKIGKELIYYMGISETPPYVLKNVKRGYWDTKPAGHQAGDTLYKLQVTLNYGYDGFIPDMFLQDKIAEYYAEVGVINGLHFIDFDGQEFLFDTGHGYYGAKRFFRRMFERSAELGVPYIRFTGATLSEGSWHYQSIYNVGGGKAMYDLATRKWGDKTSEGKDIRNVSLANYYPATFGGNFAIDSTSTIEQYEHVQAISVGVGVTYMIILNQKSVESCKRKYQIFKVIRTWENARAANAFPRWVKKQLAYPARNWTLEEINRDTWRLWEVVNGVKTRPVVLNRARGY